MDHNRCLDVHQVNHSPLARGGPFDVKKRPSLKEDVRKGEVTRGKDTCVKTGTFHRIDQIDSMCRRCEQEAPIGSTDTWSTLADPHPFHGEKSFRVGIK